MKIAFKFFIVFILSFLSTFYKYDDLNILMLIPLLAFFMFNGIYYFLTSLGGLTAGCLLLSRFNQSNFVLSYTLIGICIFFALYHFLLIINKKLILNFVVSSSLSIILTYLIYYLSYNNFNIIRFVLLILLSVILSTIFAFLIKKFSFHLLTIIDDKSSIIFTALLIAYLSLTSNVFKIEQLDYISLFIISLVLLIYSLKTNLINVLATNATIIFIGYLFNIQILYGYSFILLSSSICLSFNKSKHTYLNALLVLATLVCVYLLSDKLNLFYYLIYSISLSICILLINKDENKNIENNYYIQYVKNRNDMIFQLENFEKMFITLGDNFKKARQTRILTKAKEEVFDTLCFNCENISNCQKKGKHLLLNYVKDSLNNELDDNKIRYIKQNCHKQESYFKLLDKFTNTYLINSYKKEEENKMKNIIANDFYSFAKVMEQCRESFNKDRTILANTFFKKLNEILYDYQFDVLFIKDHSSDNQYIFDLAIKNISKDDIYEVLIPLIDSILQTNMQINNVETATLSSSYYIINISEIKDINIKYCIKQSNEDIKANGDSFITLNENKFFFLAISDGMGNGIEANEESKFTLDSLTCMLKTNMDIKTSINLTNDIVQLKNDFESYTTLDLLAIDKKKKIATFYKLGAFNTYIIRDHQVTEVNNFSLPIGIIETITPSPTSYKLQEKDIIVMCSDGMIDDTNKDIINILENIEFDDANVICNTLFSHLINIRQNSDDATLAIITIN